MTPENDEEPYLWDRTGPEDPEVARLEGLLAPLRHRAPLAPLQQLPKRRAVGPWLAGGAAALALAASVALWMRAPVVFEKTRDPWSKTEARRANGSAIERTPESSACAPSASGAGLPFQSVEGAAPLCDGSSSFAQGQLPRGAWLETDASSKVKLDVASIGHVELQPSSRVRLMETSANEHRLELGRGTLHAKINAPPRLFFVETQGATAVDLGCEYELTVDDKGVGRLHVILGFVELEPKKSDVNPTGPARARHSVLVPKAAECTFRPNDGPGIPVWVRTPLEVREALRSFDLEGSIEGLELALSRMTRRDSLTLFHLLERVPESHRARVLDLLEQVIPAPEKATRKATLALEPAALAAWREALEPRWFPDPKKPWLR